MQQRQISGTCQQKLSYDDIWNDTREAIARSGYQVGDFGFTKDGLDFVGVLETTAPFAISASYGKVSVTTGLVVKG